MAVIEQSLSSDPSAHEPQRFPVRLWLIAVSGWMFDFYDLVLFSFLLIPIGQELKLSEGQEAVLLGAALALRASAAFCSAICPTCTAASGR